MKELVMGELGDLHATPGSKPWALAVRRKIQVAIHDSQTKASNLSDWIATMRTHEGWRELTDKTGSMFMSFEMFSTNPEPYGLGYASDDIDTIIAERKDAQTRANTAKDVNANGRPVNRSNTTVLGRGADYFTARIKATHPDILERMKAGEFPSVRAAAIEAGIVKPSFQCPIDTKRAAGLIRKHFGGDLPQLLEELAE